MEHNHAPYSGGVHTTHTHGPHQRFAPRTIKKQNLRHLKQNIMVTLQTGIKLVLVLLENCWDNQLARTPPLYLHL